MTSRPRRYAPAPRPLRLRPVSSSRRSASRLSERAPEHLADDVEMALDGFLEVVLGQSMAAGALTEAPAQLSVFDQPLQRGGDLARLAGDQETALRGDDLAGAATVGADQRPPDQGRLDQRVGAALVVGEEQGSVVL